MRMAAQGCWRRECTADVAREVQFYFVIAVASDRRAGTGTRGPSSGKLVETHCRPPSADVLTKGCIRGQERRLLSNNSDVAKKKMWLNIIRRLTPGAVARFRIPHGSDALGERACTSSSADDE